jgi:hypothetical protein
VCDTEGIAVAIKSPNLARWMLPIEIGHLIKFLIR